MADEYTPILIGFKSGIVIKMLVAGGTLPIARNFSDAIDRGPTATRLYSFTKDLKHLFDVADIAFMLPSDGVEIVAGK